MNYGKKKAAKRQKKITSKSTMQGKRIVVRLFKALLICIVLAAVVGMAGGGLFIKKIIDDTPHVSTSDVKPKGFTTFVYADDGSTEIERFVSSGSNRVYKSIDEIPKNLQHAFVAIEDERFYKHNGIDLQGIARAAVVGGFKGTANLLAAQMYGLNAIGTAAHCFTLVHDDERSAFESQIAALGKNTTLLVDTYNIEEAVKTAVEVAGPELGGVRIDSGDLASLAQRVRNQLDALGATNTKITVTNDLDEYALASLQTAPVDSYGVGTMLVTGSGAPTCAMVYKLTERENSAGDMQPVAKKSKDKATVPGRKLAFRSYEYSLADCEHVISGSEEQLAAYQPEEGWRDLLVGYVSNGEINSDYQGHEAIVNAHNYRAQALAELPIGAQSLMKGDPVIPTEITVL